MAPRFRPVFWYLKKKPWSIAAIFCSIDASNDFEKQKNQKQAVAWALDNIIAAVENRQDIEKYAHVATLQQS